MKDASKYYGDMALKAAIKRCGKGGGRFPVAPGLSCVVTPAGRARFVHRYPWAGKYESLWLEGSYPREVTLAEACRQCEQQRGLLDQRINPKDARSSGLTSNPTLAEYARTIFDQKAPAKDLRLGPEKSEWLRDMTIHCGDLAGMRIDSIVRTQVVAALASRGKGGVPAPSARRIATRLAQVLRTRQLSIGPRTWMSG